MKTTFDIPDPIYREFKARTATNGETMRNATLAMIVMYNTNGGFPIVAESACSNAMKLRSGERPSWGGIAEKFITRYPDDPLNNEAMRDSIIAARKRGAL